MKKPTEEQLIERVCRRLHDEMDAAEAARFDLDVQSDPHLAKLFRQLSTLDHAFSALPELTPSATFTASVMRRTRPVVVDEKSKYAWLEWLPGLAPALGILIVALIWGKGLWGRAVSEIAASGGWLDRTLGTELFASQPFILLAILIPVAVLAVAYSTMHRTWGAEA